MLWEEWLDKYPQSTLVTEAQLRLVWLQLRDGDNRAVDEVIQAANTYIERNDPPAGMAFNWGGLTYINVVWQEKPSIYACREIIWLYLKVPRLPCRPICVALRAS